MGWSSAYLRQRGHDRDQLSHGLGTLHSQLAACHANALHALALHRSNELKRGCLVDAIVADINLQTQIESWLADCMGWSSGWAGVQRTLVSEATTAAIAATALAPSGPMSLLLTMSEASLVSLLLWSASQIAVTPSSLSEL